MLILSVTLFILCLVGTASATTWSIDDNGGDADFTGIQDAINKATDGDTIIVHSGVYYENVVVDKSVTLKGIGHPVVDAGGWGNAIRLTADGITLVGFNATNSGRFQSDGGIKVTSNNNTIKGNNASSNGVGIDLSFSSNNNRITGNNVSNNNGNGIGLSSSSNNTITGNNVSNNYWGGISLSSSSDNNTITGNNASNNYWGGIGLFSSSSNSITGNNVSNNNYDGIRLYYPRNNNTITGNVFVNDGLSYFSYQNTVEDNTVNGKPLVYLVKMRDRLYS
jgi:parallel beta-helix repeat protein